MKRTLKTADIMLVGFTVLSIIALILRTAALLTAFDSTSGYFDSSALVTYLNRAFALVGALLGMIATFFTKTAELPSPANHAAPQKPFISALAAFGFGICGILFGVIAAASPSVMKTGIALSLILSAFYFVGDAFGKQENGRTPSRLIFALFAPIAFVLLVLEENFDMSTVINGDEKILVILFFIVAALYIVEDARCALRIPSSKLYLFSSYTTAFLGLYTSIPGFIGGIVGKTIGTKYMIYYLLAFTIAVKAGYDLFIYLKLIKHHSIDHSEEN